MLNDADIKLKFIQSTRLFTSFIAVLLLNACGVSYPSPLYPSTWAPLVEIEEPNVCPDISGKYRILSELPPELEFSPGAKPQQLVGILTIPEEFSPKNLPPSPLQMIRFLPAHLYGAAPNSKLQFEWNQLLTLYTEFIPSQNELQQEWMVEIKLLNNEKLEIIVSDNKKVLTRRMLTSKTNDKKNVGEFKCIPFNRSRQSSKEKGGLVIWGAFLPTLSNAKLYSLNTSNPWWGISGGHFTFNKAIDGSLVMYENLTSCTGDCEFFGWRIWSKWPSIKISQ